MKRICGIAVIIALMMLTAMPVCAATLIHRYPLDSDGDDVVGTASLTAVGDGVSHSTTNGVTNNRGYAVFGGSDDCYKGDLDAGSTFGLLGDYATDGIGARPFTIVLWTRSTATGSKCAFGLSTVGTGGSDVTYGTYKHTGFFVRSSSSEGDYAGVYARGGGANSLVHSADVTDGNWHQVVGVFGHTYRTVYVDGVTQSGWTSSATINYTTQLPIRYVTLGAFFRLNSEYVDDYAGDMDDVQVYSGALSAADVAYLYAHPGRAVDSSLANTPAPASGQNNVLPTTDLSWTKGEDPNSYKTITGFYVYSDFYNAAGDPNLYLLATLPVEDMDYGNGAGESLGLDYATTYHWRVDEAVNNLGPEDSNTIPGVVWSFTTAYAVPVISGVSPAEGQYDIGAQAQVTADYISVGSSVTGVTWYLNDVALNPAADTNIVVNYSDTETTLTILSMSSAYEGTYYCVVSNAGGNSDPSDSSDIAVKKLLAWYAFENDVIDSAGGNNGTVVGEPAYAAGQVNQAISFDGIDDAVSIPRVIQTSFSIELWVKTTAVGGTGGWYSGMGLVDGEVSGTVNDFGTSVLGGKFGFGIGNPDTTISSTSNINDGQWHYCIAARDNTTGAIKIYVDGQQEASGTGPIGTQDSPEVLRIGSLQTAGNYLKGQIDEVKLYNYPLDELTAAAQYYAATGQSVCVQSQKPDSKYDMNGDCIVDLEDFAEVASVWLDCGLYPDCE